MQAIILAAGKGSRLDSLNFNCPKCLVPIANKPIIDYTIDNLLQVGVDYIYVVINHLGDMIIEHLTSTYPNVNFTFIDERKMPQVEHNNIYSFNVGLEMADIREDLLLIEGDIIFNKSVLKTLIGDVSAVALSEPASYFDGGAIKVIDNKCIERVPFSIDSDALKTVNIYYFTAEYLFKLSSSITKFIKQNGYNHYYEEAFNWPELKPMIIKATDWYEVDSPIDYYSANIIYTHGKLKYELLTSQYGGYWHLPGLVDCCYLNNPFFKPQKLLKQLYNQFPQLISSYPWGELRSRELAAGYLGINPENLLVGCGASELISVLGQYFKGQLLYTELPTFNEYLEFFNYTNIFKDAKIVLIVNPGNPLGQVKSDKELNSMIASNQDKLFIIDESFIDFVDSKEKISFINSSYNNVIVIKSLGKTYSINGLKLGVLISNDTNLVKSLSKLLPSWNISAFAQEFLAQIVCYKDEYLKSCLKLIQERKRFIKELSKIEQLKVHKTQTDFIVVELKEDTKDFCINILDKYNIFIKDLSSKQGINKNLVRISINTPEVNNFVIDCLKEYFNGQYSK